MKKRLAWAGLAALAAIPLLIVLDARRSASRALRRHSQEIERIAEALRARAAKRPCAFDDPQPGDPVPLYDRAAALLAGENEAIPPDHEALGLFREAVRRAPLGALDRSPSETWEAGLKHLELLGESLAAAGKQAEAFAVLLLLRGAAQDVARLWGDMHLLRWAEESAHVLAGSMLEGHALTAAEIRRILVRLDRLEASRPTLQDELDLEDLRLRQRRLDPAKDAEDLYGLFVPPPPSWRTFWSQDVARARTLAQIEDFYLRRRELAARPWPERQPAFRALAAELDVAMFTGFGATDLAPEGLETEAAAKRALLRAALEVALHEAEHGRPPDALPGYRIRDSLVESTGEDPPRWIRVRRR